MHQAQLITALIKALCRDFLHVASKIILVVTSVNSSSVVIEAAILLDLVPHVALVEYFENDLRVGDIELFFLLYCQFFQVTQKDVDTLNLLLLILIQQIIIARS